MYYVGTMYVRTNVLDIKSGTGLNGGSPQTWFGSLLTSHGRDGKARSRSMCGLRLVTG